MEGDKYVSMFKINGIPILPPLMTAARRREMLAYKELAVALETRLKLEAKERENIRPQDLESISTIEDEYLKVSSMLQDHFSPAKLPPQIVKRKASPTEILKKSDTFIYDINTNTVMIPRDTETLSKVSNDEAKRRSAFSTKFSNFSKLEVATAPPKIPLSPTKAQKLFKHTAPCIEVKPPTPERKTVEETSKSFVTPEKKKFESKGKTQRASTSPALKEPPPPSSPLVRSNSFTLETPSPVLLQHMVRNHGMSSELPLNKFCNQSVKQMPKDLINRMKPKTPENHIGSTKTATLPNKSKLLNSHQHNTSSEPSKLGTLLITNSAMFKNKKSPYEIKVTGKSKGSRKHKPPVKKISSVILKSRLSGSHHHRSRPHIQPSNQKESVRPNQKTPSPPASPISNGHIDNVQDKIRDIEEQHRLKLVELMKRQQDEQRMMQEQFEKQQKQLLEEFNAGLMSLKALSAPSLDGNPAETSKSESNDHQNDDNNDADDSKKDDKITVDESQCYDMTKTLAPPVTNSKQTPRCNRRLFGGCMSAPPPTPRQRGVYVPMRSPVSAADTAKIQSPTKRKKEAAATIINAYVRGFLVRRLFRTDHVQTIVKTIQDTLIFLINFHRETEYDMSEENILFKARLLQQLTSACQSIREIFSLPTKEKMLLIARDRINIQNKTKIQNEYNRKRFFLT